MTTFLSDDILALRPIEISDGNLLVDWQESWQQTELLAENLPESFFQREQQARIFQASDDQDLFIIERRSDHQALGWAAIYDMHPSYRQARLFLMMDQDEAIRQGHATRTGHLLIRYAFDELNIHRLECLIHTENPAAMALCHTLGFQREIIHREMFQFGEGFIDGLTYGLLNDATRRI